MRLSLLVFTAALLLIAAPDAARAQASCVNAVGAANGLCNAYCNAMQCDTTDQQASNNACDRVATNFLKNVGAPIECALAAGIGFCHFNTDGGEDCVSAISCTTNADCPQGGFAAICSTMCTPSSR